MTFVEVSSVNSLYREILCEFVNSCEFFENLHVKCKLEYVLSVKVQLLFPEDLELKYKLVTWSFYSPNKEEFLATLILILPNHFRVRDWNN